MNTGNAFSFLSDPQKSFNGKRINLDTVAESAKESVRKLINIDSGVYIATYEELLVMAEQGQSTL